MTSLRIPMQYDINMVRGNSRPPVILKQLAAGVAMNLTGFSFDLSIVWREDAATGRQAGSIHKLSSTGGLVIDIGQSTVTWTPTLAESRQIPSDDSATYELEATEPGGGQATYLMGRVIGIGGINRD